MIDMCRAAGIEPVITTTGTVPSRTQLLLYSQHASSQPSPATLIAAPLMTWLTSWRYLTITCNASTATLLDRFLL